VGVVDEDYGAIELLRHRKPWRQRCSSFGYYGVGVGPNPSPVRQLHQAGYAAQFSAQCVDRFPKDIVVEPPYLNRRIADPISAVQCVESFSAAAPDRNRLMTTGKSGILVQGDRTDRYDTVGVGYRAEDGARNVICVTPLQNIRWVVLEELPPADGITKRLNFALRERAMHA